MVFTNAFERTPPIIKTKLKGAVGNVELTGELPWGGVFDPADLASRTDSNNLKLWREAELKHSRIAMLAVVGMLVAEKWNPLFGGKILGISINHFQQTYNVWPQFWIILLASIAAVEARTISKGWESRDGSFLRSKLQDDYIPGDLGFDPLNLVPNKSYDDPKFLEKRNKELNNGRVAILAVAGIVAQELKDPTHTIWEHIRDYGLGPVK